MTPFGARVRALRAQKNISLKQMATDLNLSSAYLSALEHGNRSRPAPGLVMQIAGYLGCIWDEVEALKRLGFLSHPRVYLDTAGLAPDRTLLANLLAEQIGTLTDEQISQMLKVMDNDEQGRNI
jgi:transcriptional regulator with XRE-family HTH domain